ncbi:MAG: uL15m family ribosomal protein [Candidatus Diapherotrites archaeon]
MSVRKRRKKDKLRGQRTHGKGDTKNRRGSGSKGGKGRGGSHKNKWSKYYLEFGGTKKMTPKKKPLALNVGDLEKKAEQLALEKKAEIKGNEIFIDGKNAGIGKILSRGNVSKKFFLKNVRVSAKAREKIIAAGGKIEETEIQSKESKK